MYLLPVAIFLSACGDKGDQKASVPRPSPEAVAFRTLTDSIPSDTLPYVLRQVEHVRYTDYEPVADTLAARLLGTAESDARYYIVSKPVRTDSFTALVILESLIDTSFNVHEVFRLMCYNPEAQMVGQCILGETYYEDNYFQSVGSISVADEGYLVIVETFMSELVEGEWKQISFPIVVNQYRVEATGHIRHVKTTRNSLDNLPTGVS
jgi:hypothetical protein